MVVLNKSIHIIVAGRGQFKNTIPAMLYKQPEQQTFSQDTLNKSFNIFLCLFAGDSSTVCSVLCQSPKVYRGVQGIWQSQGMPEDAHGTPAPCSSAPEKCPNKAHEELGLWKRLQIQPHVQGACGAGLSTTRVERNRLLQGTRNVTAVLGMAFDFMTRTFVLG